MLQILILESFDAKESGFALLPQVTAGAIEPDGKAPWLAPEL
jgi:hypothetical protein